jgi:hypothetical protein
MRRGLHGGGICLGMHTWRWHGGGWTTHGSLSERARPSRLLLPLSSQRLVRDPVAHEIMARARVKGVHGL